MNEEYSLESWTRIITFYPDIKELTYQKYEILSEFINEK